MFYIDWQITGDFYIAFVNGRRVTERALICTPLSILRTDKRVIGPVQAVHVSCGGTGRRKYGKILCAGNRAV